MNDRKRDTIIPPHAGADNAHDDTLSSAEHTGGGEVSSPPRSSPSPPSPSDYTSPLAALPHAGADALEVHQHYMLLARTLSNPGVFTALLIGSMSHYVDARGLSRTNWDAVHKVQWENCTIKRCSCGSLITVYSWLHALKFIGVQDDGVDLLEMRNCLECGTTLAIRVGDSPQRSKRRAALDASSASGMPEVK